MCIICQPYSMKCQRNELKIINHLSYEAYSTSFSFIFLNSLSSLKEDVCVSRKVVEKHYDEEG